MKQRYLQNIEPSMVTHFPSMEGDMSWIKNSDLRTLCEDIVNHVIPVGIRSRSRQKYKEFSINLKGDQDGQQKSKQLIGQLTEFEKDEGDVENIVCDAVTGIAGSLAWQGRAVFEIVFDKENSTPYVFEVPSKGIWRIPGGFLQVIPHRDWETCNKKFVFVPSNRMWLLDIPPELGGFKGHRKTLRRLGRFPSISPKFIQQDFALLQKFDTQKYGTSLNSYSQRITKTWGWDYRRQTRENVTEFFSIYRMLKFYLAQTRFRGYIINELNGLLARLNIHCEITVRGLPTTGDILKAQNSLIAAKISFKDVINIIHDGNIDCINGVSDAV